VTGAAPADETAATPTDIPTEASEVTGEAPGAIAGGTVQIAYLHSDRVSHSWHMSLMNAIAYDKAIGLDVIVAAPFAVSCSGPNSLVEGRNMAATHFLDKTDSEWLFFVDTDMGFEADAIERLLLAADPVDRPVVGGLCFALKHMGPDNKGGFIVRPVPTLFMWGSTPEQGFGFTNRFRYPPETLVQVAGTGAAFLLIHRSILEAIRKNEGDHWFDFVAYGDGAQVSEDLSFCYRVAQLQRPIFVHTGVKITHHKTFWLGEDDYRMPDVEPMLQIMQAAGGPEVGSWGKAQRARREKREAASAATGHPPCAKCGNVSCDGGWGCLPSGS